VKKCASCTKDLPEAALHCVFCGAKQPPAPAVQPGLAKTAFGYSNEMMEQLKNAQPPSSSTGGPGPYVPPSPPPAYPQQQQPPRQHSPSQQPPYQGGLAPQSHANAATVFVQAGPPLQQQPYSPPQQPQTQAAFMQTAVAPPTQNPAYPQQQPYPQQPYPQPMNNPGMGVHGPQGAYNAGPIPQMQYQAPRRTGGAPVEPWKDALPLMMIVWGIATLVAFATPLTTDPMRFNWDLVIHGEGKQKIPMLVVAALGLLGVVLGAIPMVATPRGILAALLGISAVVVPLVIVGELPPWQVLVPMVGLLLILPGLLLRNEYTDAMLPRVLVTFGVIAVLSPLLVPVGGHIPLVELFKALIDGHVHGSELIVVAMVVFALVNLLVWLPGPATAGGKVFAWIWFLAPLIASGVALIDNGHVGDLVTKTPGALVAWVPISTCAVFIGYGLATVLGKQLE
jgi:hypothetical protein